MVYQFNNEFQTAIDYANKCIVEEPDFTWGYLQKNFIYASEVRLFISQGEKAKAMARLKECRSILETAIKRAEANGDNDGASEAYYRLGETYHNYLAYSGDSVGSVITYGIDIDHEMALRYGEKAVQLKPDSEAAQLFLNDVKATIEKEENKAKSDDARKARIAAGEKVHKERREAWDADLQSKRQVQEKYRAKMDKRAKLAGALKVLFVIFLIGWSIFMLYIRSTNEDKLGMMSAVGIIIALLLDYRMHMRAVQTKENVKGAVIVGAIGTILFSMIWLAGFTSMDLKGRAIMGCILAGIALIAGIIHAVISKNSTPVPEKVPTEAQVTNYQNNMKEADNAILNGNSLLALVKLMAVYAEYNNQGLKGFPELPAKVAEYNETVSGYHLSVENDYETSLKEAENGIAAAEAAISEDSPETPIYKLQKVNLMYIMASALEYLGRHDEAITAIHEMRQFAAEVAKDATDLGFPTVETRSYSYTAISYLATAKVYMDIIKKVDELGFKGLNNPEVLSRIRDRGIDNDVEKAAEFARKADDLNGTQKTDLYVLVYHMNFGKK